MASKAPLILAAVSQFTGVSQTKNASMIAIIHATGIAFVAGQRIITIRINIITIGIDANNANVIESLNPAVNVQI